MSEEQPPEQPEEIPAEAPVEAPVEAPAEQPAEAPSEAPSEEPPVEISSEPLPEDRPMTPEEEEAAKKQAEEVAKNEALKAPKADGAGEATERSLPKDVIGTAGPIVTQVDSRGKIYESILQAIGCTPLVKLPKMSQKHGVQAELLAKLEFFNPMSSSKDRAAFAMIEDAEKAGKIKQGESILVEASSGNMAVSLAFVAAAKGYQIIIVMPESVAFERRKLLQFLGAKLELTPPDKGMKGALDRVPHVLREKNNTYQLNMFASMANAQIHAETTAEEIWADTGGQVDAVVIGVGSGGTLTGVAGKLKQKNPNLHVYAVEPAGSAILSGKPKGPHKIQGIGAGFVPPILDASLIDGVVEITNEQCFDMVKDLARTEGIAAGISSGAVLAAAIEVAKLPDYAGKRVVAILASAAERYVGNGLYD